MSAAKSVSNLSRLALGLLGVLASPQCEENRGQVVKVYGQVRQDVRARLRELSTDFYRLPRRFQRLLMLPEIAQAAAQVVEAPLQIRLEGVGVGLRELPIDLYRPPRRLLRLFMPSEIGQVASQAVQA